MALLYALARSLPLLSCHVCPGSAASAAAYPLRRLGACVCERERERISYRQKKKPSRSARPFLKSVLRHVRAVYDKCRFFLQLVPSVVNFAKRYKSSNEDCASVGGV